ncbi:type II secretion system F family protein [Streptomyces sp. NPDC056656]|uniref:type II secretion system F family protein n=1 Tax=Streptomyces sp. NPDC056656 TaxID=3345895 RepID=UPI0036B1CBB1
MTLLWALLSGMAVMGGLAALTAGVAGTTAPKRASVFGGWQRWRAALSGEAGSAELRMQRRTRAAAAAVLWLGIWLVSGNFVAGLLIGVAVFGVPWLLSPDQATKVRIGQLEGLSEWTQRLAGLLRLGMGLEQAMISSRKAPPEEVAEQVITLSDRLRMGWRPEEALRAFGDELDDVTADKIVAALILAVTARGDGLASALEELAAGVREEVAKKRNTEADRAKPRTTVRWMTLITLGVIVAGFFVPSYTAPYATLLGQLVLAMLTAGFVATLALMRHLAHYRRIPRFLSLDAASTVRLPAEAAAPEPEKAALQ